MSLRAAAERELRIDALRACRRIEAFIRRVRDDRRASGVLIGVSGGVDSALLAGLAVRAVGSGGVHVAFLASPDLAPAGMAGARTVADWLGLDLEVIDTEPALRRRGFYGPWLVRFLNFSPPGSVGPLLRLYQHLTGETEFVSGLRRGDFGGRSLTGLAFRAAVERVLAVQHGRHVHRREVLEGRAAALGAVLVGAGNRSELLTGYFTPGSIDDCPISPLLGLYKTQVRQIAAHVGVPAAIRRRPPSAGGVGGIGDEQVMAASYAAIDLVLDAMDRGGSGERAVRLGVEPETVRRVRQMHRLSAWKRTTRHLPPPADGGIGGGLRTADTRPGPPAAPLRPPGQADAPGREAGPGAEQQSTGFSGVLSPTRMVQGVAGPGDTAASGRRGGGIQRGGRRSTRRG